MWMSRCNPATSLEFCSTTYIYAVVLLLHLCFCQHLRFKIQDTRDRKSIRETISVSSKCRPNKSSLQCSLARSSSPLGSLLPALLSGTLLWWATVKTKPQEITASSSTFPENVHTHWYLGTFPVADSDARLTKTVSFYLQLGPLLCVPESELNDCNRDDKDVGDECQVLGENCNLLQGTCAMFEESVSQDVCQKSKFGQWRNACTDYCLFQLIRITCTVPWFDSVVRLLVDSEHSIDTSSSGRKPSVHTA